jgi:hypothetical protein
MDRDIRVLRLTALAAAILMPALAAAQAPPKAEAPVAPKSDQFDANGCARARATVGEDGDVDARKGDGRDLSDRLARSGGVICPPSQGDPGIKAPTPPGGPMLVIPPPGGPGGDPDVQPK